MAEAKLFTQRHGDISCYFNQHVAGQKNILILHGALGKANRLTHLTLRFPGYNLLFCDLKGHGKSAGPATGYAPTSLAHDLVETITTTFAGSTFAVIAESFSGIIALELAKLLTNLQRIIMIDTPFDNQHMKASFFALTLAYQTQAKRREGIAGISHEFFGLDVDTQEITPRTYFEYLRGIRVPILMITGNRKAIDMPNVAEAGAYFAEADRIKIDGYTDQFSYIEIPGGRHRLLKTHAVEVIQIVRDLLES